MATKGKKKQKLVKPCETGEARCLFQFGGLCLAFAGVGTYYMDGSKTGFFRPTSSVSVYECLSEEVPLLNPRTWDKTGVTIGRYVPNETGIDRNQHVVGDSQKKNVTATSGSQKRQVTDAPKKIKSKGVVMEDNGHRLVTKNSDGEIVGVTNSLFED